MIKRDCDAKSIVVAYENGKARNYNKIGALRIKFPNGEKSANLESN